MATVYEKDRIIAIIGASSGIGLAVAALFIQNGDTVYNLSRRASPLSGIRNITLDIVNTNELHICLQEIRAAHGRLDILVNAAGFSMAAPVCYAKSEDYRYLFDVNFFGAIEATRAAALLMEQTGGRIIHISSIGGVLPIAYDPYYSASKAALNMFVEGAQLELKKRGIFISALMPGGTRTGFTFKRKVYDSAKCGAYADDMTAAVLSLKKTEQRGMRAERVADTVFFLTTLPDPPVLVSSGLINKLYHLASKVFSKRMLYWMLRIKYRV